MFYLKADSAHLTGGPKHRLPRSLCLYALCNGRLHEGQTVVDASSGSTAISEAWFARLLGLPFVAVMPARTAPRKIADVQALGGVCDLVAEPSEVHACAAWHAANGACHIDQFGLAERATDWRGNNNIAESIVQQMAREPDPEPAWIVCGAGTGGTSATIGRYLRYRGVRTRRCVAEPEGSGFVHGWRTRDPQAQASRPTLIEGIGRPCVEPRFVFEVVNQVIRMIQWQNPMCDVDGRGRGTGLGTFQNIAAEVAETREIVLALGVGEHVVGILGQQHHRALIAADESAGTEGKIAELTRIHSDRIALVQRRHRSAGRLARKKTNPARISASVRKLPSSLRNNVAR